MPKATTCALTDKGNEIRKMSRMNRLNNAFWLVMRPLTLVVVGGVIAFLTAYFVMVDTIDENQTELLKSRVKSIGLTLKKARVNMKKATELLSSNYANLYISMEKKDVRNLYKELEWVIDAASLSGFIATDIDGNLITASYNGVDEEKVKQMVNYVKDNGVVQGCGTFIKDVIFTYTCALVNDPDDKAVGAVVVIGYIANDKNSIIGIKEEHGVEACLYRDGVCINSTIEDMEGHKLSSVVIDSCVVKHAMWFGEGVLNDKEGYEACIPLKDYDGVTNGIMKVRIEKSVVNSLSSSVGLILVALWVCIVVLVIYMVLRVRHMITRPLRMLLGEVSVLATGDLTHGVRKINGCNEILELVSETRLMNEKIRNVIEPISVASKSIEASIGQLTSASMNMSNSANRQAASIEEISSSMEEMSANIQQTTDNSVNTNKMAEHVGSMLADMSTATNNSYEAIRNIANDVLAINELVMQTNILALNASVEAARAGEQGKGFAVVAKEVGRLADQTHETADGINETATSSIEQAEAANARAEELAPKVTQIINNIKEITAASVEQSTGVNHVNSAIFELNHITQENAAGAEEIAASVQELHRMTRSLSEAIGVFKVK